MTITPEQQQQIVSKLDEVWPKPRVCPICRNQTWKLNSRLFLHQALHSAVVTPVADSDRMAVHQQGLPVILFFCDTCGYVATFFASKFGVTVDLVSEAATSAKQHGQSAPQVVWPPPPTIKP